MAQDLKALSMLLNATPFAFVIDLACLASRREYLKLDKWLTDKIREHRVIFTVCLQSVNCLGPVVQSIVSLTTSLRRQLVKYMPTALSNTLLFFVGKM